MNLKRTVKKRTVKWWALVSVAVAIATAFLLVGCESDSSITSDTTELNTTVENNITVGTGDINTTVDANVTVIVNVIDPLNDLDGAGTFENPYRLKQQAYSGLSYGMTWFETSIASVNCTISSVSTVTVMVVIAYDKQLNIIYSDGGIGNYNTISFDVNGSEMVLLGMDYADDNATTIFTGDCLDKPVIWR